MFRYAAAVVVAAAGGGLTTRRSVETWYPGLRKPNWTPPNQAFGPVWSVLYAQMAYSAQRVARSSDPGRRSALALWWLQLGLNAAWTPVFFGARRTGAGAVIVCALLPAVGATAASSARVIVRPGYCTPRTWPGRRMRRRSISKSGDGTADHHRSSHGKPLLA